MKRSTHADIDEQTAAAMGFPKTKYVSVERERRWLCREVPRDGILRTEAITDLYLTGTKLRLREARPLDSGAAMLRLSRKADVNAQTRLITSIYLTEEEFTILARSLTGVRLRKLRHQLQVVSGIVLAVDEFLGDLEGLFIAEAEFDTAERMAEYMMPDFALREISTDPRFTGAYLAKNGLPKDYARAT